VLKLVWQVTHLEIRSHTEGNRVDIDLMGAATFVKLPQLAASLESVPPGTAVHLDIHQLAYIDHSCLDLMTSWRDEHERNGGCVIVEWDGLRSRYAPLAHSPALQRQKTVQATSVDAA
jgi:hypothetical protein